MIIEDVAFILIFIGVIAILFELYVKLDLKYTNKIDIDARIYKLLEKKKANGKLSRSELCDLNICIFLKENRISKFGLFLVLIGLFLLILK